MDAHPSPTPVCSFEGQQETVLEVEFGERSNDFHQAVLYHLDNSAELQGCELLCCAAQGRGGGVRPGSPLDAQAEGKSQLQGQEDLSFTEPKRFLVFPGGRNPFLCPTTSHKERHCYKKTKVGLL